MKSRPMTEAEQRVAERVKRQLELMRREPVPTCMGCGKVGVMLCGHCREIVEAVQTRCAKLKSTFISLWAADF